MSYYGLTSLQLLDMENCNLTGFLDASILNLAGLVELNLKDNMLSGTFPPLLLGLSNLGTKKFD